MKLMSALERPSRTELAHVYAWIGGVCLFLSHSVQDWPLLPGILPWGLSEMHPWRGHILIEARIITSLVLVGGMIGGWWWWAVAWKRGVTGVISSIAMLLWGIASLAGLISRQLFYLGEGCLVASGLIALIFFRKPRGERFPAFFKNIREFNSVFAVCFILISVLGDVVLLGNAPPGLLQKTDFVLGRILTHLIVAAVMWALLALHDRWVPRGARWVARAVLALLPLLMLADIGLRLLWSKGLFKLFAELEVGGQFQWWRAIEAGGVQITPAIIGIAALCVGAAFALYALMSWFSRRAGWGASPRMLMAIAGGAWLLLQIEQGMALMMKSRTWSWWERKACSLRLTPFEPSQGWAMFDVEFADERPSVESHEMKSRPEIFFFIVETLRSDAVRSDVTPFLTRWRETECQMLGETFAASNITQLSWFSMMSGRLPMYWEDGRGRGSLSLLPAALKASGYHVEARMVSDFQYMDIVRTNFGEPPLADHVEFVSLKHPDFSLNKPGREVNMLARMREAVARRAPEGSAWIFAFDSPHYPYSWHPDFKPPFSDYESNPIFPLRPTQEQIRRVERRYWNSVAWVDRQLEDFISHLKSTSRYDHALIIVTGDHGEEFREHGSWFHGSALNPQQTRVPLLIKWPVEWGRGPARKQASHLDLAPTIMSALRCPGSWWKNLPGRSLLDDEEHTCVTNTTYASQNNEVMLWERDGWVAAFGWKNWSESGAPRKMWLERLEGPEGPVPGQTPAGYESILRERFPDVFGKVVIRLKAE